MFPFSAYFKVTWLHIATFLTIVAVINLPLFFLIGSQFAVSGIVTALGAIVALVLDEGLPVLDVLITVVLFGAGVVAGSHFAERPTLPAVFFWLAGAVACFVVAFLYGGWLGLFFIACGAFDAYLARECWYLREHERVLAEIQGIIDELNRRNSEDDSATGS